MAFMLCKSGRRFFLFIFLIIKKHEFRYKRTPSTYYLLQEQSFQYHISVRVNLHHCDEISVPSS